MSAAGLSQSPPPEASARPLAFSALEGWAEDDHAAAFRAFLISCRAILSGEVAPRQGAPASDELRRVCTAALSADARREQARAFFEAHFQPVEITPESGAGFLTGYYEPEVEGAAEPSASFAAPLLARPEALATLAPGQHPDGLDPALQAAMRASDGSLAPAPDRAAILAGTLGAAAPPLVWLRDDVEVFLIQVQGSARVRMPDGTARRYTYAGRNGYPYTSIGKIILGEWSVPQAELTLERLKRFLREDHARGAAIMRRNRSYVFFRHAAELPAESGPIGGMGVALTPFRSIAIDRALWPYGMPVWMETTLPGGEHFHRLTVAQDTGSAIVGPARADLFHGSGEEAGARAGDLRHPMRFVALLPRGAP